MSIIKSKGKVLITFKSPDGVWDSLTVAGYSPNDLDEMPEIREPIEKFIEYMEYVTIEIDLDTAEARVVPVREDRLLRSGG